MSFALSQSSAYKIYKKIKKIISHSLLNLLSRIFLTSKTTRSSLTMHGDCCGLLSESRLGLSIVSNSWLVVVVVGAVVVIVVVVFHFVVSVVMDDVVVSSIYDGG